ncbi:MAG: S8 family serine peptidase, partial [Anaerolineae bacterium]
GGIAGLQATNPRARGEARLDAKSPASIAYLDYLANQHAQFIGLVEQTLARQVDVRFRYDAVLNGLAMELTAQEAATVAQLPGVRHVERDFMRQLNTDVGPAWIGAEGVWDGSATGVPSQGEGLIIGMIDTGINGDHPSFADPGPYDGYEYNNPLPAYLGDCAPPTPTYTCNDKLIGAYDFTTANDPEDFDGHGSHTSSTAAGNVLTDIAIDFPTLVITRSISGVAPHAHIISYRACGSGGCPNSATNASINQAVLDGVDAINYSIGGGPANPWLDSNALAYLDAREAGVFVATSAGNSGPGAATVGSPANAPWLLTVGNATHNRTFTNTISFSGGPGSLGPFMGTSVTAGYGPAAIVHAGDYGDPLCGTPFAPGTWTGEIVVCDRGNYALVDKVANAQNGGAGAVVIANAAANGLQTYAIPHVLPSTHINYADAEALRTWLASGSGHMATITEAVISIDDNYGDRIAVSSSRGPNSPVPDVIKPDVIAPGTDILAAYKTPEEYNMIGGTSMASPHAAGASLLLRSLHPNWTAAQIHSALISTAIHDVAVKEDWATPADPFDMGGGRVYASLAAQAGFVLDETSANFAAANPGVGGDPSTLNLATLANDDCQGSCTWTRVLSSTQPATVSWTAEVEAAPGMTVTVTPASFDLAAYATKTITVEVTFTGGPVSEWSFGLVKLMPSDGSIPMSHLPVAVTSPPQIAIAPPNMESLQAVNTVQTYPFTITNNGQAPLEWELWEDAGISGQGPNLVDWFDDFDSYATDTLLHNVGGWKGWGNDSAAAAYTRNTQARSAPNSIEIVDLKDAVHEYSGYTSGFWDFTAWQYIPSGSTGESYFILLNQYDDSGATNNWSTQINFNLDQDLVVSEGEAAGATLPIVRDQWMEIRVAIDLYNDVQEFYYGGDLLYTSSWSDGVSGGGILNIGAVDLWGNAAGAVYYDDMSLVETIPEICDLNNDMAWLSVWPEDGTTSGGEDSMVDIMFDSSGLAFGSTHAGNLCVGSNDPATPLIVVPMTLTVAFEAVEMAPQMQTLSAAPGEMVTYTYTITNAGQVTDTYGLAVAGNMWDTSVASSTGEMPPMSTTTVDVMVTIPTTPVGVESPIASDTFTLTAVSASEPTAMAQATGTTVAEADLAVTLGNDQANAGPPGSQVSYTFTVVNQGAYTDTYALA